MVRSRRPDGRRGAERPERARLARPAAGSVRVVAARPRRSAAGLTRRAAILALVLCAVVVSVALPLREMLSQRGQIAAVRQQEADQRRRVAALSQERARLDDPAYVMQLARERLHYLSPGETSYVVIGSPDLPAARGGSPTGPTAPWYSQLLGSLQAADAPRGSAGAGHR